MTKPVITTRIDKGEPLTFGEMDSNLTNLQNATISVTGDSGTAQALDLNDTLTIAGGTGLSTVASATDTITVNLDNTAVTPGSYTKASITVNAQGQITSASNGSADFSTADARSAISVTDAGGDGSVSYNSSTGVITYTGPSASEVRAHISAGTGISITDGAISSTITQYADADARAAISVTDAGGEGSVSYNSSTGVITYTGPSFSGLEVTSAKGQANGYASLDSNGLVPSSQLPSYVDDVVEAANFAALPGTGETSKIYVTLDNNKTYRWSGSAYVEISASPGSTDSVTEGSTNLYFTTQRARDAFSASTGISITNGAIATTITQYTDAAARSALSAGTGISYNSSTGAISSTITQYADSNARSAVSVTDAGGDGSLTYNSSTGVITYTGPSASEVRAHFSAGTGISITDGVIANTQTAFDPASPGAIGSTTASTGAFTTVSASTTGTNGALNITYNPATASGAAVQTTGKDSQGGTGYFDFFKTTNTTSGATNASKTFRVNSTGTLELINSAYTSTIFSITDGGAVTTPSLTVSTYASLKDIRETIYAIGNSGTSTLTPDAANGSVQTITATGNFTLSAFSNPVSGQTITFIITQDGTGSRTLTSTMKFSGASKTLSTAANSIDILTVSYIGTTYYASLAKGFA